MNTFTLALFASAFVLALTILQLLLLRVLNTLWWKRRSIKYLSLALLLTNILSAALWLYGAKYRDTQLAEIGGTATALVAVLSFALVASFALSGISNTIQYWQDRLRTRRQRVGAAEEPPLPQRRKALKVITAAIPVSALALSISGMAQSFGDCEVEKKNLSFPDLPDDLDGFKILHLSDSHLGPYIGLENLEQLMLDAEPHSPDLMLITGDIADHLALLPGAIKIFEGLNTRYGGYASMGNHDYYRGERQVRQRFAESSIPMLSDEGVVVKVGNAELFVGGADDPRTMGVDITAFMRRTVEKTIQEAPSESFKILMTHRPAGFDRAAELGVDLTLAGHTHGGQVGFMGSPLFDYWGEERYIRGHYRKDKSQAYVSRGVGHWFPFRLGCSTEAPVIVLRRDTVRAAVPRSRELHR